MSTHPSRPSYAAVLRVPHARHAFTAVLAARLSYGTVGLAALLSVTRATGSIAVSGAVLSLYGATTVFLMPPRAALIDRHGPRRVLPPMSALYGALLSVLAFLTWRPGAAVAPIAVCAALAGACAPPLGPTMRALWSRLVQDRDLVRRAYSLDGVAEELLFVSGPAVVGVLVGFTPPAAGLLLSAVLNVAGTCVFVRSPALPGPRPGSGRPERGGLRAALPPVVVALGTGLSLSAVELLVMAFATERSYDIALVPWVLGALSAGSALGGLAHGAVRWRASTRARLCRFAAGLGLVLVPAGLAPGLWTLAGAMVVAGAFVAPALTTAYLLADETAAEGARTRAGAWVNMGVNAGSSAGALVAGVLAGRLSSAVCFALAGGVALLSALAVAGHTRRATRSDANPSAPGSRTGTGPAEPGSGMVRPADEVRVEPGSAKASPVDASRVEPGSV
ncbi:MFS transporter [Streptomyces sp. NPDC100445]|uniref:MFS transporter n=1 Tax=Streptomyces sp. NPDC100445 TaxID=3366102 RepID=UPI00382167BA